MDPVKTGALIRQFRTQMHLTQKELAALRADFSEYAGRLGENERFLQRAEDGVAGILQGKLR